MRSRGNDGFNEVVKPALEALLSDLQHTTEVLKRANLNDRPAEVADIEPVYQEQTRRSPSRHGLDSLEHMLDSYTEKRREYDDEAGSTPSTIQKSRPTVQSLFNELEQNSSRKSIGERSGGYDSSFDTHKSPTRDPSQLDSMLGTLQNDMSKHGISTIPKGECAACGKAIVGQVVIALGKIWHPEHYVCCQCGEELGHRNFFERSGKPYCENDYHDMFSPRCAYCNGPIKDKCVTALGKTFHSEHFICAECGRQFGDEGFHEKDGKAYCKSDFFRLFAPKCSGCGQPIKMNFITALDTHWHPECFVCQGEAYFSRRCPMHVTYYDDDDDYDDNE